MAAMEPLCRLLGTKISKVSPQEIVFMEAELFARICKELRELFRGRYREYFRLMKFNIEMENKMLDAMFVRLLINDILETKEYSLEGIAYYTDTHEDVIHEVINGRNCNPSAELLRRSIELHRLVRRDLYVAIMKKIALDYLDEMKTTEIQNFPHENQASLSPSLHALVGGEGL